MTKTASASTISSGSLLTYTIVVKNTGGAALKNLVLSDQVNGVGVNQNPPALPQLTMTSTKGNCTQGGPNGNLVTCNGGAMAGGETWTVTIAGQVTAGTGTTLNNTASITGTKSAQNFTTVSNTASVSVTGGPARCPICRSTRRVRQRRSGSADHLHAHRQQPRHGERDERQGRRHATGRRRLYLRDDDESFHLQHAPDRP